MTSTISETGRICRGCDTFKTWENFSLQSTHSSGHRSRCKTCLATANAEYHAGVRRPKRTPQSKLAKSLQKTGVAIDLFVAYSERTDGCCYACGNKPQSGKRLAVDHCHATGTIRGLLCVQCNTALGLLKDDPRRLLALIEYLANPPLAA